ncbi:hypothetical protein NA57DRAFT_77126 [Rhizodiscina lignyota]|uniref:Uncharacterized protein n=1 Tax=Rhizodiscina lignyota TaxID=1504668 RepID=A0A9P4M527_9PEZI|nr:hypothetical protein NA57DRAFT_77126 [Rhizodiscina lignyota]
MSTDQTANDQKPPTYEDSANADLRTHLPAGEKLNLIIHGNSVYHQTPSSNALYELTQEPLTGKDKILGVQQVVYTTPKPGTKNQAIKRRKRHLYDVKKPSYLPAAITTPVYELPTALGCLGRRWRVSDGYGRRWVRYEKLLKNGPTLEWRDMKGNAVAVETRPTFDDSDDAQPTSTPRLELLVELDEKMLNLLVAAWVGIVWDIGKDAHAQDIKFKDVIRILQSGKGVGSKKPFGILLPSGLL